MNAEIQWENVNIAGAFVLGAILGTLATIRVMRAVLQTFRNDPLRRRDKGLDQDNE